MTKILEINELSAHYGSIQAVDHASLYVNEGEIVTLIGANGAGKSSLLMSLFGQPKPSTGTIHYQGADITGMATHEVSKQQIALVPEGRRIFAKMTVLENLLMGAIRDKTPSKALIQKIFEMFPILCDRQHLAAGVLSGGEQQMLAIGRALMSQPKLLLLDEPSLGLAPRIVQQIFAILKEIAAKGTTLFLVEQNAHHALSLADRGYVLVNGRITMTGTGQELLHHPEIKTAYLG